jgi:hypothetical protein
MVFRIGPCISTQLLAEALCGFLDTDKNGKIDGGELKVLLTLLGHPMALLVPIPKGFGIPYRDILQKLGGSNNDK